MKNVKDGNKQVAIWGVAHMWNQSLDIDRQRPYEKREHMWASELTGSYYDRYWKMQGRKPTTPPNLRARRKFEGGNMTEFVLQQVLTRAGILKSSQEYITHEGKLRVTGKADFTAGGQVKPLTDDELVGFPETFGIIAQNMIKQLSKKYPNGLKYLNIEIKSCSGMMFDRYEINPGVNHQMQAFHYAHNTDRPTLLVYVSRDDFRICEYIIMPNDKKLKKIYDDDIENMAKILTLNKKQIKNYKEPLLAWDEDTKKYKKSFKVEYSAYLKDYGFEQPSEYGDPATKIATRINNVMKRLRNYDKISTLNENAMADAVKFYPGCQPTIVALINDWHVNYQPPVKIKKGKK